MVISTFIFSSVLLLSGANANEECSDWFENGKIEPNKIGMECELECNRLMTNMATFDCPIECEKLCEQPRKIKEEGNLFRYLKGVTKGDREIAKKYPKEAAVVYLQKKRVDELTEKVFKKIGHNDESDAFRHFVWACLLVSKIGFEKAGEFLSAHENEPGQPAAEKAMDEYNNQKGMVFAQEKIKENETIELNEIEREALSQLRRGELKVLKSSKSKVPEGYYEK